LAKNGIFDGIFDDQIRDKNSNESFPSEIFSSRFNIKGKLYAFRHGNIFFQVLNHNKNFF